MNFSAGRNGVYEALQVATRAIKGKIVLPILGNVHVGANESGIRITATDLNMSIQCDVPATAIEVQGSVTVSGKVLQTILKGLPKQDLSMIAVKKVSEKAQPDGTLKQEVNWKARLQCGETTFTLEAISAEEFPPVPCPEKDVCAFSIAQRDLLKLIMTTKVSIGWGEVRDALTSAQLSFKNGHAQMVTTDTYRLTCYSAPLMEEPVLTASDRQALVPGKALEEIARLLSEKSEDAVNVTFDEQTMRFQIGSVALTTLLIQATFPKYQRIIPISHHWAMTVNRKEMIDGLKRIHIVAQDGNNYLMLRAHVNAEETDGTFSPGDLRFVAYSELLGKAEHIMRIDVTGDPIATAININFLMDVLPVMTSKTVIFEMGEHVNSPLKLREGDSEDNDFLHLVMPLQVGALLAPHLV